MRPDQTFHSGNPVTAADVVFSLTRVIKLNKTPSFIFSQFGWTPENVDQMVRATDDMTVELKIPESLAPTLVLNCLAAGSARSSTKGRARARAMAISATSGWKLRRLRPVLAAELETERERDPGCPGLALRHAGDGARDPRHVPEPGAQRLIEKGDADIARNLTADQIAGLEGNSDIVIQTDPKAT